MGRSQELSEFQHGTVIGCHLCNKSSCKTSITIPQSTVSGMITKWKWWGSTATQPRSGKSHKMMEQGQRMLRHIVRRGLSAESIAIDLQISCGLQISSRTVRRELYGMGFHGRAAASKPYIIKCNIKHRLQCTPPLEYRSVETLSGEMSSASPSGNLMYESGFGGCQENGTCLSALCQV